MSAEKAPAKVRFQRVWSGTSAWVSHISDDVRWAILPVITDSPTYDGWRVYNIRTGELLEEDFANLNDAKHAVEAAGEAA